MLAFPNKKLYICSRYILIPISFLIEFYQITFTLQYYCKWIISQNMFSVNIKDIKQKMYTCDPQEDVAIRHELFYILKSF